MFEELIELKQHLKNYFPDTYIEVSARSISFRSGKEETALFLVMRNEKMDFMKVFPGCSELLKFARTLILSECVLMNRKIEESNGYLKMRNLN